MWLKDILQSITTSLRFTITVIQIEIPQVRQTLDASGIPTPVCPLCGCEWLMVPMTFDQETYDVAAWGMDGECFSCGTKVTVCCPVDAPSWIVEE